MKKIFCAISVFVFSSINGMVNMPFRIGFEFQVNGRLCEWALRDITLQKSPVVTIKSSSGAMLGHIELDGPDIEFVTNPFSHKQRELLVLCIRSLKEIVDFTRNELNSKNEVTIEEWGRKLSGLKSEVLIEPASLFERVKFNKIKKPNPSGVWQPSWQPQMTVQHPSQNTVELCQSLFSENRPMMQLIEQSTPKEMPSNTAISGLTFLVAHEMVGMTNSYLLPLDSSRILDLAMSLAIYFDKQDISVSDLLKRSIGALSDTKLQDIENHKLMRPCLAAVFEENKVKQKRLFQELPMKDAFVQDFLAATPNLGPFIEIANDNQFMYSALLIRDTFEGFSTVYQFDAKRWTNFMSRRPFSHMFREVLEGKLSVISDAYSRDSLKKNCFVEIFNKNIFFADQLPNGFFLANYAEQFFEGGNKPMNLGMLLPYFHPNIQDSVFLKSLLENGVLSTTMLRVIDTERMVNDKVMTSSAQTAVKNMFLSSYSTAVLKSIEEPHERSILHISKGDTIKIDVEKQETEGIPSDFLSPPFLLDSFDAMGQYKGSEYETEKFGGAIVEFRNIQQAKRLKSQMNPFTQAGFLTIPDFVEEEVLNVFDLLLKMKSRLE